MDNPGLVSTYTGQMIACAVWMVLCLIVTVVLVGLVWVRKTPEWRTQTNRMTGERVAGLRNYVIGWGIGVCWGPPLVAVLLTVRHGVQVVDAVVAAHPWVPPVACVTAVSLALGVVALSRYLRQRAAWRREAAALAADRYARSVQPIAPVVYDAPYGEYSNPGAADFSRGPGLS